MSSRIRFEVLTPQHDRKRFSCGNTALDDWFQTRAGQDQRRNVAQVFVALRGEHLVGFYSLSMFSVSLDTLPPTLAKKLPRYEAIPAAMIGRLARSEAERGTGMGGLLLADAIKRVVQATAIAATWAIVVEAKDEAGKRFYEAHGFIPFASRPRRLFLPTDTARAAIAQSER